MATVQENQKTVVQLNSFLRGELSAVETYRIVLARIDSQSPLREELAACKASHEQRVHTLRRAILTLGGMPSESAGPWGIFARTVEAGAAVLGEKTAIAALEEGEDHGLNDYRQDLAKLSEPEVIQLIRGEILPEQEQTHRTVSELKRHLH